MTEKDSLFGLVDIFQTWPKPIRFCGTRFKDKVLHHPDRLSLLMEGMDLNLIDGGRDLVVHAEIHQPLGKKIAHADRPDQPFPMQFLHGPPGAVIVAERLMDQVQVEVVQPQIFQRGAGGVSLMF